MTQRLHATPSDSDGPLSDDPSPVSPRAWYTLAILFLLYAMHSVDRGVASVLMEPIKHEFGLDDAQAGALNALTHGIAYAIAVLPLGLLGDRHNRVRLIAILSSAWSAATIACGFAPGAAVFAAMRGSVGLAEGGFAPNALSLIGDSFPKRRRATAVGLFYGATAVGTGLVFAIGGFIATRYGWRAAFLVAGLPGVLLGITLLLTVREPERGRFDRATGADQRIGLRATLSTIVGDPALICGIAGTLLGVITVAAVWAWAVSFLTRAHGLPLGNAGLLVAVFAGPVMAIASVLSGPLTDRLAASTPRRMTLVPAAALLLTVPTGLLGLNAETLPVAVAGLILFGFFQGAWLAQGFATVLATSQPHVRGGVMSVTQLFTNLLGTGCGPLLAGALSDRFGGGAGGLRIALSLIVTLALPGACLLWVTGRLYARGARTSG